MLRDQNISKISIDGWSPEWSDTDLEVAIIKLSTDDIKQLLSLRTSSGDSVLHWAAKKKLCKTVGALLKYGADVNAPGEMNQTALHYAAYNNDTDSIKLLLASGADYRARRHDNDMPIHLAAMMNCSQAVAILLEHDAALIRATGASNRTPFITAVFSQGVEVLDVLLTHNDNINQINLASGQGAIHIACSKKKVRIIEYLATHHADINIQSTSGTTPLQFCARQGGKCLNVAEALIKQGANANQGDPSPLAILTRYHDESSPGIKQFSALLISYGAKKEAVTPKVPNLHSD